MDNVQTSTTVAVSNAGSAEHARPRRRLIPIVDPRFQWKYTLVIMALGVGLTAIMGGLLYKAHADNTRLIDLAGDVQVQAELVRGDQIFLLYLIVLVLLMGLGLGFWGLVVTHRISGPLYIAARYLAVLASGRYPDLRPLRKRDELHEFFASFEETINSLRNRDIAAMREIEAALADARTGDPREGLEKALRALERQRAALAEAVGSDAPVTE